MSDVAPLPEVGDVSGRDPSAAVGTSPASIAALGVLVLAALASAAPVAPDWMLTLRPVAAGVALAGAGAVGAALGASIWRPLAVLAISWLVVFAVHQILIDPESGISALDQLAAAFLVAPVIASLRSVGPADLWVVAIVVWGWLLSGGLAWVRQRADHELGLRPSEAVWLRRALTGTLLIASPLLSPVQPFLLGRAVYEERALLKRDQGALVGATAVAISALALAFAVDLRTIPDLDRWLVDPFLVVAAASFGAALVALVLVAGDSWEEHRWVQRSLGLLPGLFAGHVLAAAIGLEQMAGSSALARAQVAVTATAVLALVLRALDPGSATDVGDVGADERESEGDVAVGGSTSEEHRT